jgi:transposase
VAGLLDVSRQWVSEWVRAYRLGGEGALRAGRRGRRPGEKTALAPWQQAQIAKAIRDKNPDQLRLPGFLWTRALVCELIERRFGVRVGEKTAGRYLRGWGSARRSRRGARLSGTRSWSGAGWMSATRSWSGAPTASGR